MSERCALTAARSCETQGLRCARSMPRSTLNPRSGGSISRRSERNKAAKPRETLSGSG